MITDFVKQKMQKARYKTLKDGSHFGAITGLKGVWASAPTRQVCVKELQEVLEDWLVLKLRTGERITGLSSSRISIPPHTHHASHRQYA